MRQLGTAKLQLFASRQRHQPVLRLGCVCVWKSGVSCEKQARFGSPTSRPTVLQDPRGSLHWLCHPAHCVGRHQNSPLANSLTSELNEHPGFELNSHGSRPQPVPSNILENGKCGGRHAILCYGLRNCPNVRGWVSLSQ